MTDAQTTPVPDPKPAPEIEEALTAVKTARTAASAAQSSLTSSEAAAKDTLTGMEVLVTGWTTHVFNPLGENEPKSVQLIQEVVLIKAANIGSTKSNQPSDSILVVHRDGTEYLMPALTTTIMEVPPGWPRDGSYFCKTADCMQFVAPEDQATHTNPALAARILLRQMKSPEGFFMCRNIKKVLLNLVPWESNEAHH